MSQDHFPSSSLQLAFAGFSRKYEKVNYLKCHVEGSIRYPSLEHKLMTEFQKSVCMTLIFDRFDIFFNFSHFLIAWKATKKYITCLFRRSGGH